MISFHWPLIFQFLSQWIDRQNVKSQSRHNSPNPRCKVLFFSSGIYLWYFWCFQIKMFFFLLLTWVESLLVIRSFREPWTLTAWCHFLSLFYDIWQTIIHEVADWLIMKIVISCSYNLRFIPFCLLSTPSPLFSPFFYLFPFLPPPFASLYFLSVDLSNNLLFLCKYYSNEGL